MTGRDLRGEPGYGLIENIDVIDDRVRPCVPRTQRHTHDFTGRVRGAIDRVEPKPAFEMRGGAVLVLRMDLMK